MEQKNKNEAIEKEMAPDEVLGALESLSKRALELPEGSERKAYLKTLQQMHELTLGEYDIPAKAMSPEAPLVRALQFIPGVSYAPGLVTTAAGETALAMAGKTTPEESWERIKSAAAPDIPFVSEESHFGKPAKSFGEYREMLGGTSDLDKKQIYSGSGISYGDALDLLGGVALDPAILSGGLKSAVGKGGVKAVTASEAKKIIADRIASEISRGTTEKLLTGLKEMAINPSDFFGSLAIKNRFKEADRATKAAGKERFSDVFKRERVGGFTREGIQEGLEKKVSEKSADINDIVDKVVEDAQTVNSAMPKATMSELLEPLESSEYKKLMTEAETNAAFQKANREVMRDFNLEAKSKVPIEQLVDKENLIPTEPVEFSGGIEYDLRDLGKKASKWGERAAQEKFYSKPTMFDVRKTAAKAQEAAAKGATYEALRGRARELQLRGLDELGQGAKAAEALSVQSSLLEGAPYTSGQSFKGKYSTPTSRTYNALVGALGQPAGRFMFGILPTEGSLDFISTAAGKTLTNPWMMYGAQPMIRSYINKKAGETRMDQRNPWDELLEEYKKKEGVKNGK